MLGFGKPTNKEEVNMQLKKLLSSGNLGTNRWLDREEDELSS
jgi:hypothetical protein